MTKTRINVSLDCDLAEFAKVFAAENRISVDDMITQYILTLKRRFEGDNTEKILANPIFQKAMQDVQKKL